MTAKSDMAQEAKMIQDFQHMMEVALDREVTEIEACQEWVNSGLAEWYRDNNEWGE